MLNFSSYYKIFQYGNVIWNGTMIFLISTTSEKLWIRPLKYLNILILLFHVSNYYIKVQHPSSYLSSHMHVHRLSHALCKCRLLFVMHTQVTIHAAYNFLMHIHGYPCTQLHSCNQLKCMYESCDMLIFTRHQILKWY